MPYTEEDKRFLDRGKTQEYAENASFNALLPLSSRRLQRTYLPQLKWIYRIKRDVLYRQVTKTLHRFIDEDDMDFDEAAESAVDKQKFLINRVMEKKLLLDGPDDDEVADEIEENPQYDTIIKPCDSYKKVGLYG